ncbi:MAG: Eco57I restriction-modification methylase domain-containing protein, partial [Haloechinothrix sp.]
LLAAARRLASHVARLQANGTPSAAEYRRALRQIVGRCIYGVDLNPMAVELAKVSLWLEALEPGKPLGFLDAHVKCGNALIGAAPALLRGGIPDEAFKPIEGDHKKFAKALERQNKLERHGQRGLFDLDTETKVANTVFATGLRRITSASADTLAEVRRQKSAYRDFAESAEYVRALHVADAWCAAFLWRKTPDAPLAITEDVFRDLHDPEADAAPQRTHDQIAHLRGQYRFFHWHLEFPDVFTVPETGAGVDEASGWAGGFDCVLGNPPWERIKLQEQEFFAQRDAQIATARNAAARKTLIAALKQDPDRRELYQDFETAKRKAEGESHFLRNGGRYPLTGRGDINTYAVFSETDRTLTGSHGRMGVIVPTGIATDATTQYFFKDLVQHGSLAALYDFENASPLFPGVHRSFKFCILSLVGRALREPAASFAFFLHDPAELDDAGKAFALTPEEITLLNPNTGTCPVFRSRRDAEITLGIYRRVPVLIKEPDEHGRGGSNPWGVSFMTMFHMSNDSHLFHTREELEADGWTLSGNVFTRATKRMLPLYEAKMLHHYDHRWATYDQDGVTHDLPLAEKQDPTVVVLPRYWVSEEDVPTGRVDKDEHKIMEAGVTTRLATKGWDRDWLLGWRDICRSTDERTAIPGFLPRTGVGHKFLLELPRVSEELSAALISLQGSLVFDFVARQKIGGTSMAFFVWRQLAVPAPNTMESHTPFITQRIIELTYTAHDMAPFARDLGDSGAPFRWDENRRAVIRAELDALFFHLYGISRDDADYILDTFPIVKRKDEAKYGTYRTKDLILAEYDRMAAAGVGLTTPLVDGENYTSTLTPPPDHGPRHPAATSSADTEGPDA